MHPKGTSSPLVRAHSHGDRGNEGVCMNELYELPDGWEWKNLNDVCIKITDGAHKSPKTIENGYPYITVKDVDSTGKIDFDNCKLISDVDFKLLTKANCMPFNGDILFSKDGTVGKVALVNYDTAFVVLSSLAILRPSEFILSVYLKYFLQSPLFMEKAIKSKTGAAIKRVVLRTIKEFDIPLPPLQEQKRIVSKLDTLFEKIDKAIVLHQKNMDEADVFMGSILNEVFGNKIYGLGGEALEDLCELIVDCEHKTAPTQETGYPSIRTPNIGKGFLILDNVNRVSKETYNEWTKRAIPQENDLILAREAPAGNVAVIPKNLKVCLGQRTVLLRPKKDKFNSNYLAFLLLSKDVQQQLLAHSRGATVSHINMKDIRAFKIYNLLSLSEQQKTVIYLDKISEKTEKVKQVQKEKMESLKALKASILDRAFRGEL